MHKYNLWNMSPDGMRKLEQVCHINSNNSCQDVHTLQSLSNTLSDVKLASSLRLKSIFKFYIVLDILVICIPVNIVNNKTICRKK